MIPEILGVTFQKACLLQLLTTAHTVGSISFAAKVYWIICLCKILRHHFSYLFQRNYNEKYRMRLFTEAMDSYDFEKSFFVVFMKNCILQCLTTDTTVSIPIRSQQAFRSVVHSYFVRHFFKTLRFHLFHKNGILHFLKVSSFQFN